MKSLNYTVSFFKFYDFKYLNYPPSFQRKGGQIFSAWPILVQGQVSPQVWVFQERSFNQ